jgi:hypothetical protein
MRQQLIADSGNLGRVDCRTFTMFDVAQSEDDQADVQISRIRLSDKTSRLRPRLAAPTRGQAYEPVMPDLFAERELRSHPNR